MSAVVPVGGADDVAAASASASARAHLGPCCLPPLCMQAPQQCVGCQVFANLHPPAQGPTMLATEPFPPCMASQKDRLFPFMPLALSIAAQMACPTPSPTPFPKPLRPLPQPFQPLPLPPPL